MWAARAVLALLRKEFLSLMAASATSFIWHCKGTTFSLRFTNTSQENIVFSLKILCVLAWSFGHLVICQNRKRTVKIRHYNINILFIYSEQWPRFRNRKWPNDLDQMTTLKMPFTTATTPYSPILSQNTKPVATTPINIWHFSWNQPKISLSLQCQNLD